MGIKVKYCIMKTWIMRRVVEISKTDVSNVAILNDQSELDSCERVMYVK